MDDEVTPELEQRAVSAIERDFEIASLQEDPPLELTAK